ncbi:MAG: hypothetical protein GX638_05240, partial [Crenarchaeota archaeon]|nr:hypothetical protein [Thermoproteota archaeon]
RALIETTDGGFALAGFGEPQEEGLGWIWFAKIDMYGNLLWNKKFSGPVADCPSAIIQTEDDGFILSDVSYSYSPDQGFFRLIKLDMQGNIIWNTTYGGEGKYVEPECNFVISTKDEGYLLCGYLWDTEAWLVKTDQQAMIVWNQTYGEKGSSITNAIESSNGYLLGSISNFHTAGIISINQEGEELWNLTFPEVTWNIGYESNYNSIININNNEYLMLGTKNQNLWLAKLNVPNQLSEAFQKIIITKISTSAILSIIIIYYIHIKNQNNITKD